MRDLPSRPAQAPTSRQALLCRARQCGKQGNWGWMGNVLSSCRLGFPRSITVIFTFSSFPRLGCSLVRRPKGGQGRARGPRTLTCANPMYIVHLGSWCLCVLCCGWVGKWMAVYNTIRSTEHVLYTFLRMAPPPSPPKPRDRLICVGFSLASQDLISFSPGQVEILKYSAKLAFSESTLHDLGLKYRSSSSRSVAMIVRSRAYFQAGKCLGTR